MQNNIKALRLAQNETQPQLAEAMGVTVMAVSYWETGRRTPNVGMLLRLSQHFKCTLDELLRTEANA